MNEYIIKTTINTKNDKTSIKYWRDLPVSIEEQNHVFTPTYVDIEISWRDALDITQEVIVMIENNTCLCSEDLVDQLRGSFLHNVINKV